MENVTGETLSALLKTEIVKGREKLITSSPKKKESSFQVTLEHSLENRVVMHQC